MKVFRFLISAVLAIDSMMPNRSFQLKQFKLRDKDKDLRDKLRDQDKDLRTGCGNGCPARQADLGQKIAGLTRIVPRPSLVRTVYRTWRVNEDGTKTLLIEE